MLLRQRALLCSAGRPHLPHPRAACAVGTTASELHSRSPQLNDDASERETQTLLRSKPIETPTAPLYASHFAKTLLHRAHQKQTKPKVRDSPGTTASADPTTGTESSLHNKPNTVNGVHATRAMGSAPSPIVPITFEKRMQRRQQGGKQRHQEEFPTDKKKWAKWLKEKEAKKTEMVGQASTCKAHVAEDFKEEEPLLGEMRHTLKERIHINAKSGKRPAHSKKKKAKTNKKVEQTLGPESTTTEETNEEGPLLEETWNASEENTPSNARIRDLINQISIARRRVGGQIFALRRIMRRREKLLLSSSHNRKALCKDRIGRTNRCVPSLMLKELANIREQHPWWHWHQEFSRRLHTQTMLASHGSKAAGSDFGDGSSRFDDLLYPAASITRAARARLKMLRFSYREIHDSLLFLLYPEPPNSQLKAASVRQCRPGLMDRECFLKYLTGFFHFERTHREVWLLMRLMGVRLHLKDNNLNILRLWLIHDPFSKFYSVTLKNFPAKQATPPSPTSWLQTRLYHIKKEMLSLYRDFSGWLVSLQPVDNESLAPYSETIKLQVLRQLSREWRYFAMVSKYTALSDKANHQHILAVSEIISSGRPLYGERHLDAPMKFKEVTRALRLTQRPRFPTSSPALATSNILPRIRLSPSTGKINRMYHTGELPFSTCSSVTAKSCTADNGDSDSVGRHAQTEGGSSRIQLCEGTSDPAHSSETLKMDADALPEEHTALSFQIPHEELQAAMRASKDSAASFWRHDLFRGPNNENILVHYCQSFDVAERVARHFVDEKVLGFDIEWKANASSSDGIKANVSLIQLSCENRISLFHISLFKGTTPEQLMPPTLKHILQSPEILKLGVCIVGDCTRIQKYLDVKVRGQLELSHLYKLVKYSVNQPKSVNRAPVSMKIQAAELLQLPLEKNMATRTSDWSKPLGKDQIGYAATDAYAGFRLYHVLEAKRKMMVPTPPRPEFAELGLPIKFPAPAATSEKEMVTSENSPLNKELASTEEAALEEAEEYETAAEDFSDSETDMLSEEASTDSDSTGDLEARTQSPPTRRIGRVRIRKPLPIDPGYPILPQLPPASDTLTNSILKLDLSTPEHPTPTPSRYTPTKPPTPEFTLATEWAQSYLNTNTASSPYTHTHAPLRDLRAYHLWHHQHMSLEAVASHLRDPPLSLGTVANYIVLAIVLEKLPFKVEELKKLWQFVPLRGRFRGLARLVGE